MAVLLDQTRSYAVLEHVVVVLQSLGDEEFYNNMVLGIQSKLDLDTNTNDLVVMGAELMGLGHNSADKLYNKRLVTLMRGV